jgi:hypothetical membrane protein
MLGHSFAAEHRIVTTATRDLQVLLYQNALRWLSVAGPVAAVGVLAVQQALRPDLSPTVDAISAYGVGAYAYVEMIAFWTLAAGSLALAVMLGSRAQPAPLRRGAILLGIWSGGIVLMSMINIDDGPLPTSGVIHLTIATLSFVAAGAAVVWVSRACAHLRIWTPVASASWTLACLAGLALAGATEESQLFGLTERMLGVTIVCWLIAVGRTVGAPSPLPA